MQNRSKETEIHVIYREFKAWRAQQVFATEEIEAHAAVVEHALRSLCGPAGESAALREGVQHWIDKFEKMFR